LDVTVGLQDLNSDFAVSDNGGLFNNSSFGIHSSISENISSPIFPLTALGLNLKWNVSESFLWQVAVFDGTPDDYASNPYNIHWQQLRVKQVIF
jgi:porin